MRLLAIILACAAIGCGNYGTTSNSVPSGSFGGGGGVDPSEGVAAFSQTTYPILAARCSTCHAGSGPGTPALASPDTTTAYNALLDNQKVNLGTPDNSRIVQRLVADLHFCWSSCPLDGLEMRASIEAWSALVAGSGGGTSVVGLASTTRVFDDGILEVTGERYAQGLLAMYEFKEGTGEFARDTSGVSPAMDLLITNAVEWMPNYGLNFLAGRAMADALSSRKLYDRIADPITGTDQYSVEAWVVPANTTQEGPARIVSYSNGTGNRNFTLGQTLYYYDFRNRMMSAQINSNGGPSLETNNDDEDLQAVLQHVVITFDRYRGRRIYVNGRFTDDVDPQGGAALWNWNPGYRFTLGNETTNDRPWMGQIRYVAVYDHSLPEDAIINNFNLGVGKKLRMRFDVSQWVPGAEVEFGVSELDGYSYLFCEPTVLGQNTQGLRVENVRIEVNDLVPASGQAFTHVSAVVDPSAPQISRQCSVVPKDLGPDQDVFRIVFEVLGNYTDPVVVTNPPPIVDTSVADPLPAEGVRDFARINDSMATLTGVDPNSANVQASFQDLEQQLPASYDLRSFVSSQQVGITKLALEYCDSMVESSALRDAFFGTAPAFAFDQPVTSAFSPATTPIITNALVDQMVGVNIANQPTLAEAGPLVDGLISGLTAGCFAVPEIPPCDATRTRAVVKAACASVLGSATVSMH